MRRRDKIVLVLLAIITGVVGVGLAVVCILWSLKVALTAIALVWWLTNG